MEGQSSGMFPLVLTTITHSFLLALAISSIKGNGLHNPWFVYQKIIYVFSMTYVSATHSLL